MKRWEASLRTNSNGEWQIYERKMQIPIDIDHAKHSVGGIERAYFQEIHSCDNGDKYLYCIITKGDDTF